MPRSRKYLVFWSPRILCILFALFLGMFAFDVFDEGHGPWMTALAFVLHLAPTSGLVIALLILSWRRERVGGVLFLLVGGLYLVLSWGKFDWVAYVAISGPLFAIGVLFLMSWFYREEPPGERPD